MTVFSHGIALTGRRKAQGTLKPAKVLEEKTRTLEHNVEDTEIAIEDNRPPKTKTKKITDVTKTER